MDKGQTPKGKRPEPDVAQVDVAEVQAALARIEGRVDGADFVLLTRLLSTLLFVMNLVQVQRSALSRLRRFFGFSKSEKTAEVLGKEAKTSDPAAPGSNAPSPSGESPKDPEKSKAKGHGRLPAADYGAATHVPVPHPSLCPGDPCPGCGRGKLYDLKEPARLLRIVGQPLLAAMCWDCQRLRCSGCGQVYTAPGPKDAQGPKFEESAVSMLALCRYGIGLPHNRLEGLQQSLQTPIPSATQWQILDECAPLFLPVFAEMTRQAAQGNILHEDDTYARILSLMGKRRAKLLLHGDLEDPDRTGLFTTGILSLTDTGPIALFRTGRKYADENLADLLKEREADRVIPIVMSDGLDSRNVPKDRQVDPANCAAHARRGFVDQALNFPSECTFVLETLRKVYHTDAQCKKEGLSAQERLLRHQRDSLPVMEELHRFLSEQFTDKRVEPNSGLGKAYWYMLKRWHKLTLFLRRAGAPIDNNLCERALKRAICHRRNSLFYRSQRGADVGDLFMSLIYTAELRGENPFTFLTAVQRHAKAAADHPADWLPWTYRKTLARLAEENSTSPTPPPRAEASRRPVDPAPTASASGP